MIPELVLKLPKVLIVIGAFFMLRCEWRLKRKENVLEFSSFGYFLSLLVELFYIPLVDYMYYLMCKVFFGQKFLFLALGLGILNLGKNI